MAGAGSEETRPAGDGFLEYAAIVGKGVPPVLDGVDEELILSFLLSVDVLGYVETATLFRDSRTGPSADPEPTPLGEQLTRYVEAFRFESLALRDGTPAQGRLMLDLRVTPQGVDVATRAGNVEELNRRLAEVYRLADGRNLDLRPPPHPPERAALYRAGSPTQARGIPSGPDQMRIVWKDGRPAYGGACFGCDDLRSVLMALGVRRDAVRFEDEVEDLRIGADIVTRDGASRDDLLAELSQVLKERFDLDLRFQSVSEASRTLVLRGSIGAVPPDDEEDGRRVLHVFTDRKNDDRSGSGGGPFSDTEALVMLLSVGLGIPVVDETTGTVAEPFHVRIHRTAHDTERLDLLIRNMESQTNLDIVVEERFDQVVVVSEDPQ